MPETDRIAGECRTADAEEKKSQYLCFSYYMSGLWECFLLGSLELSLLTCVEGCDIYTVDKMATPVYTSAIDFGLYVTMMNWIPMPLGRRDPRQELIVIDKEEYYLSFLRTATEESVSRGWDAQAVK
jgi:hypothetical protein